jgi:hypothetical protein
MTDDYTPIGREPDYFSSYETQTVYWLSQIAKQLDRLNSALEELQSEDELRFTR